MKYVIELETYTELDYEAAERYLSKKFDTWRGGGCSCIVKTNDKGDTIVGRNMDLTISNKPAYVVRTKCKGAYETVGLAYSYFSGPNYEDVLRDGISEEYRKIIPFLCCDVMNSEGLYVEINMRTGEQNEDGSSKFGCTGTNPGARRINAMNLSRYIAENCANVRDAVEYVRNDLDLYTPNLNVMDWNFCFMIADRTGDYGLIEIAKNKVSFLPGQQAQCNFYVTPELHEIEDYKAGLGRYDLLMSGIDDVQTEAELFELINKVKYSLLYQGQPKFDIRSELVGSKPGWTDKFILDDANADAVSAEIARIGGDFRSFTRQELQDAVKYWESIFTVVANCNERSLKVRFFEDDERRKTLAIL